MIVGLYKTIELYEEALRNDDRRSAAIGMTKKKQARLILLQAAVCHNENEDPAERRNCRSELKKTVW
jgi:hypothetical protein